ncbi:MAG TPA: hypothetical protein VLT36_13285 [Candidatus Dormibacteraeota bacterium]|nr:hypothetical protein [Candidatus Dormibacteraeota bacterium]
MIKVPSLALATASLFSCFTTVAQFADSVVSYTPGGGVSATFTDPSRALGSPTGFIGYQNADPFNPPYQSTDLVSVGAGGSITVQFDSPILNSPTHSFGIDFNIFGNSGFIITNGDFSGGGITDGSLFANNTGATRVWVSADNLTYYQLDPSRAPVVDGLAPTDASGDFSRPINPALTQADFAGKDLAGIRALYNGSGGGAGYDISWAQDGLGNSVLLPSISFVRVDVLSGKSEIDALAVVPEPSISCIALCGLLVGAARKRFHRSMK